MTDFSKTLTPACGYAKDVSEPSAPIDMCAATPPATFKSTATLKEGKFSIFNEVSFPWPQGANKVQDDVKGNHVGHYLTYIMHPDDKSFFRAYTNDDATS